MNSHVRTFQSRKLRHFNLKLWVLIKASYVTHKIISCIKFEAFKVAKINKNDVKLLAKLQVLFVNYSKLEHPFR